MKFKYLPLYLFFIFFIQNSYAENTPITFDQQWLNLYRYIGSKGNFDSIVTNDNWFFHPQGRSSPQKEIEAAIRELKTSPKSRCKFPARTLYLKNKGLLPKDLTACPDFAYFKRKVRLESVWMVFASYYVNNPSSAFGHTLFKLQGEGNNNDLLEYGVNFAAQMTTQNPFLYALFGLTGGFQGNFSLLPYFVKISEYNDSETRDLWEYRLNLSSKEKEMFLSHLWEMDKAKFDYYYLTENCSYHLLLFLDAIRPSLKFREKLPYFVIPSETLTLLNHSDLVDNKKVRPSQFKKTKKRYENLSSAAKAQVQDLNPRDQADLLDYKIDFMDLKKGKDLFRKEPQAIKEKRSLQAKRAKLYDQEPKPLNISSGDSPHLIHPSHFIGLGRGWQSFSQGGRDRIDERTLLTYRFSFHEYLDPQAGAPSWSQLMLGKVEGAYNHDRERFELSQFTLFKTEANQENIEDSGALSWGLEVGARNHPNTTAYDLGIYLKSLVGINLRLGSGLFRFITPFEVDYSRPKTKDKAVKLQLKAIGQWLYPLTKKWRFISGLGLNYATFRAGEVQFLGQIHTQYDLSKNIGLRLKGDFLDKDINSSALLLFYY